MESFLAAFPPPPIPGWVFAMVGGIIGLCLGSFATALSWRRPRHISIILPPSRCPACSTRLTARDLMPLFSWLISRGRCRHCSNPVSMRYPLIETGAGACGVAIALFTQSLTQAALLFLCLPLTITALTIRIEQGKMDRNLVLAAFVTGLAGILGAR